MIKIEEIKSPLFYFDEGNALYWICAEVLGEGVRFLRSLRTVPLFLRGRKEVTPTLVLPALPMATPRQAPFVKGEEISELIEFFVEHGGDEDCRQRQEDVLEREAEEG